MKFLSNLFVFGAFVAIIAFTGCRNTPNNNNGAAATLAVGIQNSPSNALMIIAAEKGFFDTTQVRVSIKEFAAGKLALQALLGNANDVEVSVSAETPVVLSSLAGNPLHVIGCVVNAKNECRMVVRKDGAANTPETYFAKPRKIATSQGGSPEWLTYNFLKKYKLGKDKVEVVAMQPQDMQAAITNGAVDGINIFDPMARNAEKELAAKGQTFLNEDMKSYYVLSVKPQTLKDKAAALGALMAGLDKAAEFVKTQPQEAQAIVAAKTKLDAAIIASTWANYNFTTNTDADLWTLCEQEANWAIETAKYPKGTPIPNFKAIIDPNLVKNTANAAHN